MRKIVAPSLALLASAAVLVVAACSKTSDGPVSPMVASTAPRASVTPLAAAELQVCVDPASPAMAYTFTAGSITNAQTGDATHSPLIIDTSVPGPTCGVILDRVPAGSNGAIATVTVTASTGVAGTFSYICTNDSGGATCDAVTSGTNDAVAGESSFHGSTLTFLFVAAPPPPPRRHRRHRRQVARTPRAGGRIRAQLRPRCSPSTE